MTPPPHKKQPKKNHTKTPVLNRRQKDHYMFLSSRFLNGMFVTVILTVNK